MILRYVPSLRDIGVFGCDLVVEQVTCNLFGYYGV